VIEELAGAAKDLIKAGRVRQFGMSEAAAGTIRPLAAEGAPRAI
jgi:aryl-alcohol dehydrogenase-like predicted oxidoreductase